MSTLDPTQIFWVGENPNRNRPILMVWSSGSGPSISSRLSVGFEFWSQCRYLDVGADIWPDRSRFGRYLAGFVKSRLDLNEISPIWWISCCSSSKNKKYHQIRWITVDFKKLFVGKPLDLAGFCWFYGRVGWFRFLGRKPASRPEGIEFYRWRLVDDCRIDRFGWWPIGFGWVR